MLPTNLSNSYARYKHDTDALASWLASTANQFGYSSKSKTKSTRKKGKARKDAQKGGGAGGKNYTIAIKDFTVLAEFIATKEDPKVQVPQKLAILLNRTIAARQWFGDNLSAIMGHGPDKQDSDDGHAFFLTVLKEVRRILGPCFAKTHASPVKEPESLDDIVNLFEHLDVQETSEEFENAPDVVITPSAPLYRVEREVDDFEESCVAFHFYLHDLGRMRQEIQQVWKDYQHGVKDLMVASIETNTAVDLARAMDEDLKPLFVKFGGAHKMHFLYYLSQLPGQPDIIEDYHTHGQQWMYDNYTMADRILWPAAMGLQNFCSLLLRDIEPELKPGFYGTYVPTANRSWMSNREKFGEDRVLLLETVEEIYFYDKINPTPAPAEDEFTRLLRQMFKTRVPAMPVIFAATLFLDIHHVLRDKASKGHSTLAATADYAVKNVNDTLEFYKDIANIQWTRKDDAHMKDYVEFIKEEVQDDHMRTFAIQNERENIPGPFLLFRLHPWLCGLWRFNILISLSDLGFQFVNKWGAIMPCAHLYNAVRSEKMLPKVWKELKVAIDLQGDRQIFMGEPASNATDCMKRYCLITGMSVAKPGQASKRGVQGLRQLGPVSRMFRERFCTRDSRLNLRTEDVEKIIAQSEWVDDDGDGSATTPGKSKAAATNQLSIPELLRMLGGQLQAEVDENTFDYFSLHRVCWQLLRDLKDACRDDLIVMYGPKYLTKEVDLVYLVGFILMTASSNHQVGEVIRRGESGQRIVEEFANATTLSILKKAADVINHMIENQ